MPSSIGKGSAKTGGGKSVVTQWIEKFDAPPLSEMFRGIIDLDGGNLGNARVYVLGRYSIENYLLDPVTVFGVLIDERKAPLLPNVTVTSGDEHLLRTLPAVDLQRIVDHVAQCIEPALGALSGGEKAVTFVRFTNGTELNYPGWMLTRRGHDLLPIYQRIFGQMTITPPRLEKSFRRVRLIPIELADIMSRLQEL